MKRLSTEKLNRLRICVTRSQSETIRNSIESPRIVWPIITRLGNRSGALGWLRVLAHYGILDHVEA